MFLKVKPIRPNLGNPSVGYNFFFCDFQHTNSEFSRQENNPTCSNLSKTFDTRFFQPLGHALFRRLDVNGTISAITLYWSYLLPTLKLLCIVVLYLLFPSCVELFVLELNYVLIPQHKNLYSKP